MELILGPIAAAENNVIGNKNDLPWGRNLKGDLKHFKDITSGHAVIMGRKTFESIGKALPNRINIVLTRDTNYSAPDILVAPTLEEASAKAEAAGASKAFIIGGASLFSEGLDKTDKLYLTRVHAHVEGDTLLPDLSDKWKRVSQEKHFRDEQNIYDYTFEVYERKA